MSLDNSTQKELEAILAAMTTEQLDTDKKRRLSEIIGESKQARKIYLDHCQVSAMLRNSSLLAALKTPEKPTPTDAPLRQSKVSWIGIAAACAMILIGAITTYLLRDDTGELMRIVRVVNISGEASSGDVKLAAGTELSRGKMQVESGSVTVQFDHGTNILIEAPAELSIDTDKQVSLISGKVAVLVSEESSGFTILGPGSAVVDLGTEFAMAVVNGDAWVEVYQGEVDIALLNDNGQPWKSRQLGVSGPVHINSAKGEIVDSAPPLELPRFVAPSPGGLDTKKAYIDAVIASKPLHYWRFDDAVEDRSIDQINGVTAEFKGVIRHHEGGLHFPRPKRNYGSVYIATPDPEMFKNEFSLEFWIQPTFEQKRGLFSIDHRHQNAVSDNKSLYQLFLLPQQHGTVHAGKSVGFSADLTPFGEQGKVNVFSGEPYATAVWQHVVAVRHRDRIQIYLNGKAGRSAPVPHPAGQFPTTITIGNIGTSARPGRNPDGYSFKGLLDELAIYPRALPADEIIRHYHLQTQ